VRLTNEKLFVMLPSRDWVGSETVVLTACDPDEQCASVELVYTVLEVNDAPVMSTLTGQVILGDEEFVPIVLDEFVSDEDNTFEELTWTVTGGDVLDVSIEDGAAILTPQAGWTGTETLVFEACDPGGLCASAEAYFQVAAPDQPVITYVHNAGFMYTAGDTVVLVDAFHTMVPSRIRRALVAGEAPFDGVDLVLFTHIHGDHFDAGMVDTFMHNNLEVLLLAPQEVIDAILAMPRSGDYADRLTAVDISRRESTEMTVAGVLLEIYNFPHGTAAAVNYGFVVHLGGAEILHPGDLSGVASPYLEDYGFGERTLDVLLVPAGSCTFMGDWLIYLEEVFTADAVFLMHEAPVGSELACEEITPIALRFEEPMTRWVVP
jgi:L-ascorbate metabolism protein UlaG (beta-lactamase superfamily)